MLEVRVHRRRSYRITMLKEAQMAAAVPPETSACRSSPLGLDEIGLAAQSAHCQLLVVSLLALLLTSLDDEVLEGRIGLR